MRAIKRIKPEILNKMKKDVILIGAATVVLSVLCFVFMKDIIKSGIVFLIGSLCAILLAVNEIERDKSEKKKKEEALKGAYPSLVYALTGFTEGGMSVQEGFKMIEKHELITEPLLKEQVEALNFKVSNGMSLERAIGEFARKTGIKEYKKLAGLISQNERAGSIQIVKVMELELVEAEHMKLRYAKERTEKKKVLMLLPITALLMVVILILMGPAFIQLRMV